VKSSLLFLTASGAFGVSALRQLQALPISNPDPIPKRHYTKKKTHGKADARGVTTAEVANRTLVARERAERAGRIATPEESDDEGLT
jgi:hypothetical protein